MWFHMRLLEKCNLRCSSCYAGSHDRTSIMGFKMVKEIVEKIREIKKLRPGFSVIYLSGGEPLLHPDFFEILDYCYNQCSRISILTNGTLIKEALTHLLKYRETLCVQVSLDGDREINDRIRGKGVFDKAVDALVRLKENNIKHWISYTVSRLNTSCFKDVLDICKKTDSFFNNVTPYTGDADVMLGYEEWKEFKYQYESYAAAIGMPQSHGENCCGFRYNCGANHGGLTINPDGSVAGCARINNICGRYEKMETYITETPLSIHETCMKPKWGTIRNFKFLSRLE